MIAPDGLDGMDAMDRLATSKATGATGISNAADLADAAHDLANKKAKLAEQAHRSADKSEKNTPGESPTKQGAFARAIDASSDKLISGGLMFAGFSLLLTGMMFAVPAALTLLPIAVPSTIATVMSAAATGAVWLGGNEFVKVYRQASKEENSRLNRAVEKVKSRFGHAHENPLGQHVGELSMVAGQPQPLAEMAEPAVYENAAKQNPAIQAILEAGPRARAQDILAQGSKANLSAEQRAEQARESQPHHCI